MPTQSITHIRVHSLLFAAILCFISVAALAQKATVEPLYVSPGALLDNVFDHLGNRYTLGQISINDNVRKAAQSPNATGSRQRPAEGDTRAFSATHLASCSPGYFRLYLEDGCGMENASDPAHAARLAVVCQVLTDISAFIESPCSVTGQKVNIWVQAPGSGSGFLGVAAPFFSMPYAPSLSGITDNMIWITLNSGADAWTNVTSPVYLSTSAGSFYHGSMSFQFNGSVAWHTDLATPPPAGKYDLYTTVLHEMMHALGFHTLINYNGLPVFNSGFNYFSRFDRSLRTLAGSSLITNTGACALYNYSFNSSLSASAVLSPGSSAATCPSGYQTGASTDHTTCTSAVSFVSGASTIPVYTPSCFEKGSSLSHFEDECTVPAGFPLTPPASNNHYHLMSNAGAMGPYSSTTNPAAMKRYPVSEERMALCTIGYKVGLSFGSAANLNLINYTSGSCSGVGVAGINDGISAGAYTYFSAGGAPVAITEASLLANDFGATQASCLQVVNGTGTVSGSGTYTYTPGVGEYGVVLLRYLPANAAGAAGNITYVYLYVGSASCPATPCDIVVNGDFEQVSTDSASCGDIFVDPGNLFCWDAYCASPDLIARGCGSLYGQHDIPSPYTIIPTDIHPLSDTNNKHFLHMGASNHNGGPFWGEGLQSALASELVNGQEYIISCWAKAGHSSSSFIPYFNHHIVFAVSPRVLPLAHIGHQVPALPVGLCFLWDLELPTAFGDDWHYFEKHFVYTGDTAKRIVAFCAPYLNVYAGEYNAMAFLDEVSIRQASTVCSFVPPSICNGTVGTIDLSTFVSVPGGTFSWPTTPVAGLVPTIATSAVLNVADAITANTAMGGNGMIPVAYTYTNTAGCVETVYANIFNLTSSIPAIVGDSAVAVGAITIFDNAANGGVWSSGNTAVATVDALTGRVKGIAAGTAMITYRIGTDCITSRKVTVYNSGTGVGTVSAPAPSMIVIPNPSQGIFKVQGTIGAATGSATLTLIDITGRTLAAKQTTITNGSVDYTFQASTPLPAGVYLLRVQAQDISTAIRVVIQR